MGVCSQPMLCLTSVASLSSSHPLLKHQVSIYPQKSAHSLISLPLKGALLFCILYHQQPQDLVYQRLILKDDPAEAVQERHRALFCAQTIQGPPAWQWCPPLRRCLAGRCWHCLVSKGLSPPFKKTRLSSSFALRKKTGRDLLPHTTEVYSNYLLHTEPQIGVIWAHEESTPGGAQVLGKPCLQRLCHKPPPAGGAKGHRGEGLRVPRGPCD